MISRSSTVCRWKKDFAKMCKECATTFADSFFDVAGECGRITSHLFTPDDAAAETLTTARQAFCLKLELLSPHST